MITLIKWLPHLLMIVCALVGLSVAGIIGVVFGALTGEIVGWIVRRILIGNIGFR